MHFKMEFQRGQVVNFKWKDSAINKAVLIYNKIVYGEEGFTHSGIITDTRKNTVEICEAIKRGFIRSDYSKEWIENKIKEGIISVGTPKPKLTYVQYNALQYENLPYSYWDLINIFLIKVFGKSSINFSGPKQLICSEAVARVLYDSSNKKLNLAEEFNKAYDLITPMDLYVSNQIEWEKL